MPGTTDIYSLDTVLSPSARDALKRLELFARRTIEGMLHGIHRSRRKGVSTEFDHHTAYYPGAPLKHVDWKVSARHDHYYVKRYLEDTALTARLVVDRSGSMGMRSEDLDRYLQATRLAACLAYLVLKERDAVGLALTGAGETVWLPARSLDVHLVRIMKALVAHGPAGPNSLADALRVLLDRNERKGLIILVSDFMFEPDGVRRQLSRLCAQGHEVLLFQLRDPTEEDFPFNRWVQFEDLEVADNRIRVDTVPLKKVYREEYQAVQDEWRRWAQKFDIHFVSARTDICVETMVSEYAAHRAEMMGK